MGINVYIEDKDVVISDVSFEYFNQLIDQKKELIEWLEKRINQEKLKHKKQLKSERNGVFVSTTTVKRRELLKVLREVLNKVECGQKT